MFDLALTRLVCSCLRKKLLLTLPLTLLALAFWYAGMHDSLLLNIGEEMLAGEILYRSKDYDAAFEKLAAGVALEDQLAYDEPWWAPA